MCVYVYMRYIYIYIERERDVYIYIHIYIYIYTHIYTYAYIHMFVYIYIYIYIYIYMWLLYELFVVNVLLCWVCLVDAIYLFMLFGCDVVVLEQCTGCVVRPALYSADGCAGCATCRARLNCVRGVCVCVRVWRWATCTMHNMLHTLWESGVHMCSMAWDVYVPRCRCFMIRKQFVCLSVRCTCMIRPLYDVQGSVYIVFTMYDRLCPITC